MDVIARYAFRIGESSTMRLTAGYNDMDTRVIRVKQTPPLLAGFQETLFGRVERGRIAEAQPNSNVNFTANYSWRDFGVMARTIRFGQVTNRGTTTANDQVFEAKWISDLDLSIICSANSALP